MSDERTHNQILETFSLLLISMVLSGCLSEEESAGETATEPPANSAPQISGTAKGHVNAGEYYSFTPTASDPDGDVLTFSVVGLPSWAGFNTTTGQLSGNVSQAVAAAE